MDLRVLMRVLWEQRGIVAVGAIAAVVLATLSYAKPVMEDGRPSLEPRKSEVWQASVTLFLTQRGFTRYTDPARFTSLAPLYARLANSDAVTKRVLEDGPLIGSVRAVPTADTTYGAVSGLPMITVFGTAPTAQLARSSATRLATAFTAYLNASQTAAKVPESKRVIIQVLNAAGSDDRLLQPRKKTLPILVLLTVLFAAIGLAYVRANTRPAISPAESAPTPVETAELPRPVETGSQAQRWRSSTSRTGT